MGGGGEGKGWEGRGKLHVIIAHCVCLLTAAGEGVSYSCL